MKICFVVSYFYKWRTFSNVKAHYDYLKEMGYEVDLYNKHKKPIINYSNYDVVLLMGAGTKLDEKTWLDLALNTNTKIISFGWSDPNLFSKEHANNCHVYFTNDLQLSKHLIYHSDKPHYYYYQTACDKKHHKNLNLEKTTDILVYGVGNHKFVTNRNRIVNKLRRKGFHIKVFGRGWEKHPDTYGFIEGERLIEEINKAKILLDITNETTSFGHRVFEGCGCGTPVLSMWREDLVELFTPYKEVLTYKTIEDIMVTLEYYLNAGDELTVIGKNAQQRCYKDHDISVRIQELLKILKEIGL